MHSEVMEITLGVVFSPQRFSRELTYSLLRLVWDVVFPLEIDPCHDSNHADTEATSRLRALRITARCAKRNAMLVSGPAHSCLGT